MADLIKKYDIFNPDFFKRFFQDEFLTDSLSYRRLIPPVNISEINDKYIIEVSIPGIEKDDIKIRRQGNTLILSYEQQESEEHTNKNYYRREFQIRSFSRSFNIPEDSNLDNISSRCNNGILTIFIPKFYKSKPKDDIIDIEIE